MEAVSSMLSLRVVTIAPFFFVFRKLTPRTSTEDRRRLSEVVPKIRILADNPVWCARSAMVINSREASDA